MSPFNCSPLLTDGIWSRGWIYRFTKSPRRLVSKILSSQCNSRCRCEFSFQPLLQTQFVVLSPWTMRRVPPVHTTSYRFNFTRGCCSHTYFLTSPYLSLAQGRNIDELSVGCLSLLPNSCRTANAGAQRWFSRTVVDFWRNRHHFPLGYLSCCLELCLPLSDERAGGWRRRTWLGSTVAHI